MRTIQIHPLSLAVGAIAVSAAFLLTAQTTPPAQTTWPPPKAMIVNKYEDIDQGVIIPVGATHSLVTVPADRWLTITGAYAETGAVEARWAELTASGVVVPKGIAYGGGSNLASPEGSGGPVGWTFAPGSSVVVWNDPPQPPATGGPITLWRYVLIGYYSRN